MIPVMRIRQVGMIALLGLLSGCATLPKTSKDFEEVTRRMDVIAVLPPSFSLGEVGAFSSQQASELTRDIELEVRAAAETLVTLSRYKKAGLDVSDSALAADSDLRTGLFEQNQAMGRAFEQLAKTESKTVDVDYAGNVDVLADRAQADYLLCISGGGYFKTAGAKTKEAVTAVLFAGLFGAVPATGGNCETVLSGALVDARTKKIVWYNRVTSPGKDPRKPSHLLATAQELTAPLLGKVKIKADKSRDEIIIDKYKALKKD